jgi:hypothetical protein
MILVAVLVGVASAAPKPATRPDPNAPKVIDGYKGVAAAVPKDKRPPKDGDWTKLQEKAANDWSDREFNGQTIRVAGVVAEVEPLKGGGARLAFKNDIDGRIGGQAVHGSCVASFREDDAGPLLKLSPGAKVTVEARVIRAVLYGEPALNGGTAIGVHLVIDRAKVVTK